MTAAALLLWYGVAALAWHRYVYAPQVHDDGLTRFGARVFALPWLPVLGAYALFVAIELIDRRIRRRR